MKPIIDLITPVTKVAIDLGYDRAANPGIPQTFKLVPIVNPVTLAVDLVVAGGQGIHDAVEDITGNSPAPFTPSGPSPMSTLAPNGSSTPSVDTPKTRPPVDNSVVSLLNKDLKPNTGTLSPTDNDNGSLIKPKAWKPGTVLHKITTGIKDAIGDLTKPHSSTTPDGQTGPPAGASAPSNTPKGAAA